MRNHGVDPGRRFGQMREHVEAMQAIWRDDEASYAGRHVNFERIWSWPKPVQRPGPPILVGGNGKRRARPRAGLRRPLDAQRRRRRRRAARARRGAARRADRPIGVTVNAAPSRPERLERYAEAGVERCVFYVPSAGADAVEAKIERVLDSAAQVGLR